MTAHDTLIIYSDEGSVSVTTQTFANCYSSATSKKTTSRDEFNSVFARIIDERIAICERLGINDTNLLINNIEDAFQKLVFIVQGIEVLKEDKSRDSNHFLVDLPTMILYTMLLESKTKRDWFALFKPPIMKAALKEIHHQCYSLCSHQTLFSEESFIKDNEQKVKVFLYEIDPALIDKIALSTL